ncbi:CopD family protein [Streptomyces sp. ATexAB-D23]|uniref:CopD family protein n=1 Tax=unclassified Streptomyces TaxID=2593676 RepID=UPI0003791CC0|nr:CopD family protein [Streptomyces sp. ATexAB-D23]
MLPARAPAPARRRSATALLALAALWAPAVAAALLGASAATHGTGELRIPGAGTATLLRAVLFGALAVHLGTLAVTALARSVPGRPDTAPRGWSAAASVAGALAAAGQIVRLARVSDLGLVETYATREGGLLLLTANGFALAACCAVSRRPGLAALPLAAVVGAEALRAHPEAYSPLVGAALTVVHLTAASLWTGGLVHVLRTLRLWRAAPDAARALLARYARLAAWLYAALAVTGTCSALRRLPADVVLTSAYGRTLLAKLALMAVVSVLALSARRRLRSGADPAGAHRAARREVVALVAVVLVSAVLTVVPDPHWLSTR